MWRWVSLHGPNRVPVVRVVALSVDIKQYIHIFRKGILRWVHVGVSQSRVVRFGMLAVNDRVMMGHPAWLLRTYFHRYLANVHTLTDTHKTKVKKSKVLCLIHRFDSLPPITWNWTRQFEQYLFSPSVCLWSFWHLRIVSSSFKSDPSLQWVRINFWNSNVYTIM